MSRSCCNVKVTECVNLKAVTANCRSVAGMVRGECNKVKVTEIKVTDNVKMKRRRVLSEVLTRADGQPISVDFTSLRGPPTLSLSSDSAGSRDNPGRPIGTGTGCREMKSNCFFVDRQRPSLVRQNACDFDQLDEHELPTTNSPRASENMDNFTSSVNGSASTAAVDNGLLVIEDANNVNGSEQDTTILSLHGNCLSSSSINGLHHPVIMCDQSTRVNHHSEVALQNVVGERKAAKNSNSTAVVVSIHTGQLLLRHPTRLRIWNARRPSDVPSRRCFTTSTTEP